MKKTEKSISCTIYFAFSLFISFPQIPLKFPKPC